MRHIHINGPRASGRTTMLMSTAITLANKSPDYDILFITNSTAQKTMIDLRKMMEDFSINITRSTFNEINLGNRSRIWVVPVNAKSGRGVMADCVIIDDVDLISDDYVMAGLAIQPKLFITTGQKPFKLGAK